MIPYLVVFDNNKVSKIVKHNTDEDANRELQARKLKGESCVIYYVHKDLDMKVGDELPDDSSDEMDFKGFE